MKLTLDHVQLAMPRGGEEQARRFYNRVLGIPEVPKPPELARNGGAWFEDGPLKVHMSGADNFTPARASHLAFIVDDLATLTAKLKAASCPVDERPERQRIFTEDPFGNRIELIQAA